MFSTRMFFLPSLALDGSFEQPVHSPREREAGCSASWTNRQRLAVRRSLRRFATSEASAFFQEGEHEKPYSFGFRQIGSAAQNTPLVLPGWGTKRSSLALRLRREVRSSAQRADARKAWSERGELRIRMRSWRRFKS